MKPHPNPVMRTLRSFSFAFKGVYALVTTQSNAIVHFAATIGVVTAGFLFKVSAMEWVGLVISMGIVWLSEGFNTAIEAVVDLASPEIHPLAGKAKDVAAGAVLLAAISAAIVAGIIFVPKIMVLLQPSA